ncbi:MAG: biosynthetic arginine decarboxylase [Gammaproteobacteria bacterium]|nr:biosynthetic arginine decarboxylase [Gammaproteobacteria bacterium]
MRAASQAEPAGQAEWTVARSEALYRVSGWSDGFFHINDAGKVCVRVSDDSPAMVIADIIAELRKRSIRLPALIRFQDVLRARVQRLHQAFNTAIADSGYSAPYRGVYPIKVNQLHEVVEEVLEAGRPFGMGLECGSKTELIAALAHLDDDEALLICNGVKDSTMMRLMLAAQRLGKNVIPVVEKYHEFEMLMSIAEAMEARPRFGVRVRLATSGSGKWAKSGGDLSKFGVSIPELMQLVGRLQQCGMSDALVLLHFHLGSQLADIQIVKHAVKEIAHIYAQLVERSLGVKYLDVGGGLSVNYESQYDADDQPINYNLQEYANAIVYAVKEVCDVENAACPVLISESGRAITAHHSVLVVPVLGAFRKDAVDPNYKPGPEEENVIHELYGILADIRGRLKKTARVQVWQLLESFHDAAEKRGEADQLFTLGYLPLEQKATAERLYWSICQGVHELLGGVDPGAQVPAELRALDEHLVDQYLCDFSVFQSILDHWAIGQGFPIMPLERLNEEPTRRATLVDLTCDSDGKVDHYVSALRDRRFLPVHGNGGTDPYYLGFFLMGAYQDIMGDSHNLFGRVAEVHVYSDAHEPNGYYIEKIIPGTTVEEMLADVQYFPSDLKRRMNEIIRRKVDAGVIRPPAGVQLLEEYMKCFADTTYIDHEG